MGQLTSAGWIGESRNRLDRRNRGDRANDRRNDPVAPEAAIGSTLSSTAARDHWKNRRESWGEGGVERIGRIGGNPVLALWIRIRCGTALCFLDWQCDVAGRRERNSLRIGGLD